MLELKLLCWNSGLPQRLSHSQVIVLRQCSPGAPGPWPKWTGDSSQATAGSTAGTKMPLTWCMRGQDSFQVPWRMVLDPTPPTKACLSVDGCWIVVVEGEYHDGFLFQACCWCHFSLISSKDSHMSVFTTQESESFSWVMTEYRSHFFALTVAWKMYPFTGFTT